MTIHIARVITAGGWRDSPPWTWTQSQRRVRSKQNNTTLQSILREILIHWHGHWSVVNISSPSFGQNFLELELPIFENSWLMVRG